MIRSVPFKVQNSIQMLQHSTGRWRDRDVAKVSACATRCATHCHLPSLTLTECTSSATSVTTPLTSLPGTNGSFGFSWYVP